MAAVDKNKLPPNAPPAEKLPEGASGKPGRKTAPDGETKAQAFVRIAVPRTENAIGAVRLIGNLAERGNYEYTQEQADKVCNAIQAELDKVRAAFREGGRKVSTGFTL